MRKRIGILILSSLLFGESRAVTAVHEAKIASESSLAAMVQTSMGLGEPTGDFLNELAGALRALSTNKPPQEVDQSIRVLAQRASKGAASNSFTPLLLSQFSLTSPDLKVPRDWRFGTSRERRELVMYTWNKAISLEEKNPGEARIFARGALVLAAHEGLALGDVEVRSFCQDFKRLTKVAQFDQDQVKSMQALISTLNSEVSACAKLNVAVFEAEKTLIESDQKPLPFELVKNSIRALKDYRDFVKSMKGPANSHLYGIILASWNLRNLVLAQGDEDSKSEVETLLKEWSKDAAPDSPEQRWIHEAMSTKGKPLARSRILGPGAAKTP